MGRKEKIPPPLLLITTIVKDRLGRGAVSSPARSWIRARSPVSSNVGLLELAATPSAVERVPSMPLVPRLASILIGIVEAEPNASTSRIGMLLETNKVPPG